MFSVAVGRRGRWWCVDCRAAATGRCEELHTVRSVRRELQAGQQLQAREQLQVGQPVDEDQALAVLELLAGECQLTMRSEAGHTYSARVQPGRRQQQRALRSLLLQLASQRHLVSTELTTRCTRCHP